MGNALKIKARRGNRGIYQSPSIKSDYANAYYNMGNAFKDQGKLDEATEAYTKASIKPDYVYAITTLALFSKSKVNCMAIAAYTKALSIKPDYADAYNNMGNTSKIKLVRRSHSGIYQSPPLSLILLMLVTTWEMLSKIKVS